MKQLYSIIPVLIFFCLCACGQKGPRDQEECRASSAREAKNKEALQVLLEYCTSEFPASRDGMGGYEYQGKKVSGPKPSYEEMKIIDNITSNSVSDFGEMEAAGDALQ